MIWDRERFIAHNNFEFTGREMFCELFGPLFALEKEWAEQGASIDEINMTAFDFDYVLKFQLAVKGGAMSGMERIVLEDNDEFTIYRDHLGRKSKLCKASATIPLPLSFAVETMDDWLKIKHWYEFSEARINKEELLRQKALRDKGYMSMFFIPGAFDEPRELLGEENLCIACYEEPEMIEDMLNTMQKTALQIMERVEDICPIDCLSIHEDMAGKSGPLFGPIQVQEFMVPYYSELWNGAKSAGARMFSQDSDGNMNPILKDLIDCKLTTIHPCEPAAGMDIVEIREKYGKQFALKGGIDKHALRFSKADILKELEYKICDLTKGGGTVFALDHRIPNGVSIENYRYYVNTAREMLGIEPISSKGWERMAF